MFRTRSRPRSGGSDSQSMTRFDRLVFSLARRVPITSVITIPLAMAGGESLGWIGNRMRVGEPWEFILHFAGGALGALGAIDFELRWFRRLRLRKCSDCFRPGRWSVRLVCRPDDSLAIPEPPTVIEARTARDQADRDRETLRAAYREAEAEVRGLRQELKNRG